MLWPAVAGSGSRPVSLQVSFIQTSLRPGEVSRKRATVQAEPLSTARLSASQAGLPRLPTLQAVLLPAATPVAAPPTATLGLEKYGNRAQLTAGVCAWQRSL